MMGNITEKFGLNYLTKPVKGMRPETPKEEITRLACYLAGYADATQNAEFAKASTWLTRLAPIVCAGDIVGCEGGDDCTSDHK